MNQPDPAPGPVDLFLTTQDTLTISAGAQHLGLFRLSPRGAMRWYATCCKTPLFNTATGPKVPFLGIRVATMTTPDRVGPVIGQTYKQKPGGKTGHQGMTRIMWNLLPRILAVRLSGRWRQTPLFDTDSGEPVAKTIMPSKEERAALYPDQRNTKG